MSSISPYTPSYSQWSSQTTFDMNMGFVVTLILVLISSLAVLGQDNGIATSSLAPAETPQPHKGGHHHHHHHKAPAPSPSHSSPPVKPPTLPAHPPVKPPILPAHPPVKPPTLPAHPPVKPPSSPVKAPTLPAHPPVKPPSSPVKPPILPTHPPVKPPTPLPKRQFVGVRGVVYCKSCKYRGVDSLLGASPIEGAVVKLACNNTKYHLTGLGTTDKNGFFFIQPNWLTTSGFHKCKVFLAKSPKPECSVPTNFHNGQVGALLVPAAPPPTPSKPVTLPNVKLFDVGPFAFEPSKNLTCKG